MWWEDKYKQIIEKKENEYREYIAELLDNTFGYKIDELYPVEHCPDSGTWIQCEKPDRSTNDGCEHYIHIINGKHYILRYTVTPPEWEQFIQPIETNDNSKSGCYVM